jgi:hypothetical protein
MSEDRILFEDYIYTYVVKDFIPRGFVIDESRHNGERFIILQDGDHEKRIPAREFSDCTFIEPGDILDYTFHFRKTIAAIFLAESLNSIKGAFLETKDYKWAVNFSRKDLDKFTFSEVEKAITLIKSIAWEDHILTVLIEHENILKFSQLKSKDALKSFIEKQYQKGLWTELDLLRYVDFVAGKRSEFISRRQVKKDE